MLHFTRDERLLISTGKLLIMLAKLKMKVVLKYLPD
jgi:hypothetical protein